MKRRSKAVSSAGSDGEQGFWPSYADMMSSFALILFFLMLLSYLSNLETGNNLKNTEARLSDTLSQLTITREQVEAANESLAQTQGELDEANALYATVQIRLDEANADLANQQLVLSQLQSTIDSQAQYVADAQVELEKMHGQMETIVGIRKTILLQIKDSIDAEMGDSSRVSIGDNGNIILNEGIFFDTGSSTLKGEAMALLNQLIDVFSQFLHSPENAKYIDSIVISGHTDSDGGAELNRNLSTARANAVLNYMLSDNTLCLYSEYFCAAGYGATRPVASNLTEEGKAQNRRIEISIILKDDTVMDIVNEYLDIDMPSIYIE